MSTGVCVRRQGMYEIVLGLDRRGAPGAAWLDLDGGGGGAGGAALHKSNTPSKSRTAGAAGHAWNCSSKLAWNCSCEAFGQVRISAQLEGPSVAVGATAAAGGAAAGGLVGGGEECVEEEEAAGAGRSEDGESADESDDETSDGSDGGVAELLGLPAFV